jgi:hypothetical protein
VSEGNRAFSIRAGTLVRVGVVQSARATSSSLVEISTSIAAFTSCDASCISISGTEMIYELSDVYTVAASEVGVVFGFVLCWHIAKYFLLHIAKKSRVSRK